MIENPAAAYRSRLEARREEWEHLDRLDLRLSIARGTVFVGGIAAAALGASTGGVASAALVFLVLVLVHASTARRCERARRRTAYYEERLDDQWEGKGCSGSRYEDAAHPYSGDLDLFGTGSVFERICTARTRSGQDTLAQWLLGPASPQVVTGRQEAVRELRPRLDLREDLGILGGEVRGAVDSTSLRRWLESEPAMPPIVYRALAIVGAAATVVTLGLWLSGRAPMGAFAASLVGIWVLSSAARRWTVPTLTGFERPAHHLETLLELVRRLERESFESPLLGRLHVAFENQPSREIARLRRWVELADSRKNLIFGPIAFAIAWDIHVTAGIEAWRGRAASSVAGAVDALGELEALSALAGYAFERPEDSFPSVVEGPPLFDAEAIGHPLIPNALCVRNDLRLDSDRSLLVVTGSNMSGKSTLLRTIGLGAVLAQAGAPVPARELRLSPLAVGTSIRIFDSLRDGRSRFYAEITRVRQIMDLAARPGLLFLLDEIFHGTNSADRRTGAEAVVHSLVERGAIGLVTSHDLALAEIADDLAPRAANVHFEDHLEGETIAFDYRLKEGPVKKSNALALMRAVGLEV